MDEQIKIVFYNAIKVSAAHTYCDFDMDDSANPSFRQVEELVELILRDAFANAREKSSAAEGRERTARKKFDYLRAQMIMALFENTKVVVGLGRRPKSQSHLNLLSQDLVQEIWSFVGMEKPVAATIQARSGPAILPFEGWCSDSWTQETKQIDLSDMTLYQPGQNIIIPLTTPEFHMTAPCYRDLRKYIKAHAGWDAQRIVATLQQRTAYSAHQKGKVYFINAIYKVRGQPPTKKRPRKTETAPFRHLLLQQRDATSALAAAVQSARINGQVDPTCLHRAVGAGYSKYFVLGQVAEYWDGVKDATSQAKKSKT